MFSVKHQNCLKVVKGVFNLGFNNYFFSKDDFCISNTDIKKKLKIKNKYLFLIEICNNYNLTYIIKKEEQNDL